MCLISRSGVSRILIRAGCIVVGGILEAADRSYRIGQKRDVDVVKLITKETIEVGPTGLCVEQWAELAWTTGGYSSTWPDKARVGRGCGGGCSRGRWRRGYGKSDEGELVDGAQRAVRGRRGQRRGQRHGPELIVVLYIIISFRFRIRELWPSKSNQNIRKSIRKSITSQVRRVGQGPVARVVVAL